MKISYLLLAVTITMIALASTMTMANAITVTLPDKANAPVVFDHQGYNFENALNKINLQWIDGTKVKESNGNADKEDDNGKKKYKIFTDGNIEYEELPNALKETLNLDAKPYITPNGDYLILEFDIKISDNVHPYYNRVIKTDDFTADGDVNFVDSTMARYTFMRPFINDSSGNFLWLKTDFDKKSILGFFEHWLVRVKIPVSYLESASYPVQIDPTAVSGCTETASLIDCSGGTFAGNWIHTVKNISIRTATMNARDVGTNDGLLILNSTLGWINVTSSTINANGVGASDAFGNGNFQAINAPNGFFIRNSVINAYGSVPSCTSVTNLEGGAGSVSLTRLIGQAVYENATFLSYGGNGCAKASYSGRGGSGQFISNSTIMTVQNGNLTINSEGGNSIDNGGHYSEYDSGGGSSICTFRDAKIQTLTTSQIFANCAAGEKSSGAFLVAWDGDVSLTFAQNLFNGTIFLDGRQPAGDSRAGNNFFTMNFNKTARYIFSGSLIQLGQYGDLKISSAKIRLSELTFLNGTALTDQSSITLSESYFNVTDVGRIGFFNRSTFSLGLVMPLSYEGVIGAAISNDTTNINFGSVGKASRNDANYYAPLLANTYPTTTTYFLQPQMVQFNTTHGSDYNTPTKVNFRIYSGSGTLLNNSNVTASAVVNTTSLLVNISGYGTGLFYWNSTFWYDTTSSIEAYNQNQAFVKDFSILSESWRNVTYERSTENFTLNVTYGGSLTGITPQFIYNGTPYLPTIQTYPTGAYYVASIPVPNITTQTNYTFYWSLQLLEGATSSTFTTQVRNQSVFPISLDNCTTNTFRIFNFTMYNEDLRQILNATGNATSFELTVLLSPLGETVNPFENFSATYSLKNPAYVCLNVNLNGSRYRLDVTGKYTAAGFVTRFYSIDNRTMTNDTIPYNVDLHLLKLTDSTSFLFGYTDENGIERSDYIVRALRKYIGEGVYREIESPRSDNDGSTILHLVEEDIIYAFNVTIGDRQVFLSQDYTAKCLTTPCQIMLNAQVPAGNPPPADTWDLLDVGTYAIVINQSTRIVYVYYNLNVSSNMTLEIVQDTGTTIVSVGNSSQKSISGVVFVQVPNSYAQQNFIGRIYIDGVRFRTFSIEFKSSANQIFGGMGLLLGALIILCLAGMAISQGEYVFIWLGAGFVAIIFFNMIELSWTTIPMILSAFIILVWKLNARRGIG